MLWINAPTRLGIVSVPLNFGSNGFNILAVNTEDEHLFVSHQEHVSWRSHTPDPIKVPVYVPGRHPLLDKHSL